MSDTIAILGCGAGGIELCGIRQADRVMLTLVTTDAVAALTLPVFSWPACGVFSSNTAKRIALNQRAA